MILTFGEEFSDISLLEKLLGVLELVWIVCQEDGDYTVPKMDQFMLKKARKNSKIDSEPIYGLG